jgi:tryptophan synthase alpha chain
VNRLDKVARELSLRNEGQLGVICPPSLPPFELTLEFVKMSVTAGADMVFTPFMFPESRYPWMMGPTEQMADKAALHQGITADMCFDCMKSVRDLYQDLPIVIVSFASDVFGYGQERFIKQCAEVGIDGMDTPGYSFVRNNDVTGFRKKLAGVDIHLIHPISIELAMSPVGSCEYELLRGMIRASGGFVFLMADPAGKGGGQSGFPAQSLKAAAQQIKTYQRELDKICPIITVCGISSPELAGAAYRDVLSDGVLVSSAIIRRLNANESLDEIKVFLKSLKDVMHR